jgi:hypothetical protein
MAGACAVEGGNGTKAPFSNGLAEVVLVLLLLDPTRPLAPVFVLLALAVVPWFLRR